MQFDNTWIYAPDKALKITTWNFNQDLRQFFPETDKRGKYGNNDIGKILVKRRVLKASQVDTEFSCLYATFKTKKEALAFLKRLNALPEVASYKEPEPLPEELVAFAAKDWRTIRTYLQDHMSAEQWKNLMAGPLSEIGMYKIDVQGTDGARSMAKKKMPPINENNPPVCEECDEEMERYYEAADTGKDGWRCPECGWSYDD